MKIHFGLILVFTFSSLFASSKAEGENRQTEEREEKREVETLNVQLRVLSLLKQIQEQNNEIRKEISNEQKENFNLAKEVSKVMKEISNGLKENTKEIKEITKQVRKNTKFIKDFSSEIKHNTSGIKENTDESKKNTLTTKYIINGTAENSEIDPEVIGEMKEITNDIKQDTNGITEMISGVTNSTEYPDEIKNNFTPAKNCHDLRLKGDVKSGIRTVYPYPDSPRKSVQVFCDQQTEEGGWTVFQARENLPERENFLRNWKNYSHGFGNLNGEFWMGLELINVMTKLDVMELRVDLEDATGKKRFAKYESFSVEDEDEKFKLNIGSYGGTAGDSLGYHNQRQFSTMDRDNNEGGGNCALKYKGGWWYGNCADSNLNGLPHVGKYSYYLDPEGISWTNFRGLWYSMAKTKMMFRLSGKII